MTRFIFSRDDVQEQDQKHKLDHADNSDKAREILLQ